MSKLLMISNEEYQTIEAMSFSAMKEFILSPAHYKAYKNAPRKKSTPAQLIGTLVHAAVLEPDTFETRFAAVDGNRNSKAVKEQIEYYDSCGIVSVTSEQMDSARFARDAILNHPLIRDLFSADGIAESTIVETDVDSGAPIKCRPDYFIPSAGVILDIKTYADLTDKSIDRQIAQQHYTLQAIHYLNVASTRLGTKLRLFGNIFVEVEAPYGVRLVGIGDASLEKAHEKYNYKPNLFRYKQCLDSGIWENYPIDAYTSEPLFY